MLSKEHIRRQVIKYLFCDACTTSTEGGIVTQWELNQWAYKKGQVLCPECQTKEETK